MYVNHTIDDINIDELHFCKPNINKISHYTYFYKIAYNINALTLNSLLIEVSIKDINIIKENNIYKINVTTDDIFLNKLKMIETNLLNKLNIVVHKQKSLLYNKFSKNTYIYNYYPENIKMYVRISGVWESDTHIGVTSKIYIYPSTLKF